ncbi:hypothetical protein CGRA01v4_02583 [Colletotrichum graminicola]|nr:hypothetical protein CGRA01v4_02583 [Colletotrichum graminicola]
MVGRPAGHVRWAAGRRCVGAFEEACLGKTAGKDRPHTRPHAGDAVCWMPVRPDGRVFGLKASTRTNPTRHSGARRRCGDQAFLGGGQ